MPREFAEPYPGTIRTALNVRADFQQHGWEVPPLPEIIRVVRRLDKNAKITAHVHNLAFHELFDATHSPRPLRLPPETTSDSLDLTLDGKNSHRPMIWRNALGVRQILSRVPGLSSRL